MSPSDESKESAPNQGYPDFYKMGRRHRALGLDIVSDNPYGRLGNGGHIPGLWGFWQAWRDGWLQENHSLKEGVSHVTK